MTRAPLTFRLCSRSSLFLSDRFLRSSGGWMALCMHSSSAWRTRSLTLKALRRRSQRPTSLPQPISLFCPHLRRVSMHRPLIPSAPKLCQRFGPRLTWRTTSQESRPSQTISDRFHFEWNFVCLCRALRFVTCSSSSLVSCWRPSTCRCATLCSQRLASACCW